MLIKNKYFFGIPILISIIILFSLFYFIFDNLILSMQYDIPEDASIHINKIKEIHMYRLDRNFVYMLSYHRTDLYSEEEMRSVGDLMIFYNNTGRSLQVEYISLLLYYARPVKINLKKNIPRGTSGNDIRLYMDSGCVIDIIGYDGEIIKTYIMQNGLDIFYEKGKEGIYYKMPKPIINNFYISEKQFLKYYFRLKQN